MNEKINELYNILDAQDEIIEQQIAIINELKKRNKELEDGFKATTDELCEYATKIDKAIDFLHNNTMIGHCKEHYELLKILGDEENETN